MPHVGEYMTKNPQTVKDSDTLVSAHELMRKNKIRHLPVVRNEELVGILSLGDVDLMSSFRDIARGPVQMTVGEAMTPDPYCVTESAPLDAVVLSMAERKFGSVLVLDTAGKVAGIFTAVDGLKLLGRLLVNSSDL